MKNWLGVIGGLEGGGPAKSSGQQQGEPKKAASGLTVSPKKDLFIIALGQPCNRQTSNEWIACNFTIFVWAGRSIFIAGKVKGATGRRQDRKHPESPAPHAAYHRAA